MLNDKTTLYDLLYIIINQRVVTLKHFKDQCVAITIELTRRYDTNQGDLSRYLNLEEKNV